MLSPEETVLWKKEAYRRRLAIEDFSRYRAFIHEDYQEWSYVTVINNLLKRVLAGETKRVIINMPPQHGKTMSVSEDFASYCMGKDPTLNVIGCAFNSDRADEYGEMVRDRVKSPEFQMLFEDINLSADSQAKSKWSIEHKGKKKGTYYAAGVGTALTGRKGDIMIIDDYFKDRKEADSEIVRNDLWRWYHSVFRERLAPGGTIIIPCTRWHDDGLVGRLLEQQGHLWEVLIIPSEATSDDDILGRKKGEFLCDAVGGSRYGREDYEEKRKYMPPYDWAALHQQNPAPDEGIEFQRDWFQEHNGSPWGSTRYLTADFSYTDKNNSDSSVICAWDVDHNNDWYLVDRWSEVCTPDISGRVFCDMLQEHKPHEALVEKIDWNYATHIIQQMDERNINVYVETLSAAGDKKSKATAYRAHCARGKVHLPKSSWTEDFIHEHLRFPNGKHDDQVDNGSLLGRRMAMVRAPSVKYTKMHYSPNTGQHIIDSLKPKDHAVTRLA
jgi:predicted phage terminase large subunit-like protein